MSYEHLSDDDKILEAIRFVARGVSIPYQLKEFLTEHGLYELIANPQELEHEPSEGNDGEHIARLSREDTEDISADTDAMEAGR